MNINAMMQQAKKMQEEMGKKQAELAQKEFLIEKQGISIVILGDRTIKSVKINEALIDEDDPETLEDMVVIAVNAANERINAEEEAIAPQQPAGMPF
ncbi:YbaB/EbfC family nucleoid-associated protein [Mycoplasma marinum]|uniref:Nucleoid-associated protein C4B24_03465 n=1 Tax=Mycoplasma marinum TaxID=1937190 RepID=A0A4R0XVI4_9MOLU|nr:YbaB/EbfC family nucleoid-associated protein [Mycoplasma marinum]TCG10941.1 nucleoid-associated protein, YbaB/EbfC family [Mycoplasma marinum]